MLNIPDAAKVNKFIPKKTFYEKANINTKTKEEFTNLLERITWLYKLSEDTIGISKTDDIEEIQIFELKVREKEIPKLVINTITKNIPYPILFVIKYEEEIMFSIKVELQHYTKWNEDINFNFNNINLKLVYENLVKSILRLGESTKNYKTSVDKHYKKEELLKEINLLETKIKKEKQFNRKVELNKNLNKLEKELEDLNV